MKNSLSVRTAEFVSPKHPDKICDFIADSILDAYLAKDKKARVAVEVMGGHKLVTINGEVKSTAKPDIEAVVKKILARNKPSNLGLGGAGSDFKIIINLVQQSPEIAQGVDTGGAGDQGIMKGYACNETKNFMPLEYELARDLCQKVFKKYPYDGKTQVTVKNGKVTKVVVSFQNTKNKILLPLVKKIIKAEEYLINPAGEWVQGGFDADTGLSGRKLIVDNYGPEVAIGGGSFSGKDYTKVDRSGAYMARKIAVDLLKKNKAKAVHVKLAYAIGKAEPVMAVAVVVYPESYRGNKQIEIPITGYDLTPLGIRKFLKLDQVKYATTCTWGHFGRGFSWG